MEKLCGEIISPEVRYLWTCNLKREQAKVGKKVLPGSEKRPPIIREAREAYLISTTLT